LLKKLNQWLLVSMIRYRQGVRQACLSLPLRFSYLYMYFIFLKDSASRLKPNRAPERVPKGHPKAVLCAIQISKTFDSKWHWAFGRANDDDATSLVDRTGFSPNARAAGLSHGVPGVLPRASPHG
jgi:hypothetical protein